MTERQETREEVNTDEKMICAFLHKINKCLLGDILLPLLAIAETHSSSATVDDCFASYSLYPVDMVYTLNCNFLYSYIGYKMLILCLYNGNFLAY